MQRRPPVTSLVFRTPSDREANSPKKTPIFPQPDLIPNNRPEIRNMPIRNLASRDYMLNSGGFQPYNFYPSTGHAEEYRHLAETRPSNQLDCVTVAQHIEACPICSRLYDTDKTLYILAIIGLLILCFLMVKHIVKL